MFSIVCLPFSQNLSNNGKIKHSEKEPPKEKNNKVPIKLGHPHPTCQENQKQSWFHRIIRKTISMVRNNLG
jgi:hypothetical protein